MADTKDGRGLWRSGRVVMTMDHAAIFTFDVRVERTIARAGSGVATIGRMDSDMALPSQLYGEHLTYLGLSPQSFTAVADMQSGSSTPFHISITHVQAYIGQLEHTHVRVFYK